MQHTVEDLIKRINAMKDQAVELHRIRNQYSEVSGKEYDKVACNQLIEQIQFLALGIAMDKDGTEVRTEMDEWKKVHKN
tara:strand:- start:105 stop:341 length:237 start_codon:yes stop_codon:yes gene_type:complete